MRIDVDLGGVNSLLARLSSDMEGATRAASQAAAQVLYDDVKRNVAKIGKVTGNLDKSIYQVYSKRQSSENKAVYEVSWNKRTAPHGRLVEYGHIQRYVVRQSNDGKFHTLVRPGMEGKPKPSRRASQAVKDAYYVLRSTPLQIAAKPFMRPAMMKFNQAMDAAADKLVEIMNKDYM